MAITETPLTTGVKDDSGGSFTTAATASITPGSNQLVLAGIFHNASVAANAADITGLAGAGLTFTKAVSIVDTAAGSVLSIWRALSASPSSGALTATFANATLASVWSIMQFNGIDTGGTNGANAIVQSAVNSNNTGSVATITATLGAFGSVNNGAMSAHGWFNAGAVQTATPKSGWAEIHDNGTTYSAGTLADCLETQWRATNDTTASAVWTSNGAVFAIALELKAAVALVLTPFTQKLIFTNDVTVQF